MSTVTSSRPEPEVAVLTLDVQPAGQACEIIAIDPTAAISNRLSDLGFTPGASCQVVGRALFGDPLRVRVRGCELALRRREAALVRVRRVSESPLPPQPLPPALVQRQALGPAIPKEPLLVGLVGNPNVGKTTIFNALTGGNQRVANYPGVTVELHRGTREHRGRQVSLVDLPGLYGWPAESLDEATTHHFLAASRPDLLLYVLDALHVERNLYVLLRLKEAGFRIMVALNMVDQAARRGLSINARELSVRLGLPVFETIGHRGQGLRPLLDALVAMPAGSVPAAALDRSTNAADRQYWYDEASQIARAVSSSGTSQAGRTARLDSLLLHRIWGLPIFIAIILGIFQLTFGLGSYLVEWLDQGFRHLGGVIALALPAGLAKSLIVDGVIGGVGAVVGFLPLIVILFACLAVLEDTGYLARASFLLDRYLRLFGLNGHSFVPLVLGAGCSVPAIFAARILKRPRDRILTIMLAPFVNCSAKIPIHVLFAGIFFPHQAALVVMLVYFGGLAVAAGVAMVLRRTVLRGPTIPLLLELPSYRAPQPTVIVRQTGRQAVLFLRKAATVILSASVIMWAAVTFPVPQAADPRADDAAYRLEHSVAGQVGQAVAPALAPLGFNWQLGVAVVAGLTAKEVVVSTLAVLYGAGDNEASLARAIRNDPTFDPRTAFGVMLFFALFTPCLATLGAIRAELGWKWVGLAVGITATSAWLIAFLWQQVARFLGIGG